MKLCFDQSSALLHWLLLVLIDIQLIDVLFACDFIVYFNVWYLVHHIFCYHAYSACWYWVGVSRFGSSNHTNHHHHKSWFGWFPEVHVIEGSLISRMKHERWLLIKHLPHNEEKWHQNAPPPPLNVHVDFEICLPVLFSWDLSLGRKY